MNPELLTKVYWHSRNNLEVNSRERNNYALFTPSINTVLLIQLTLASLVSANIQNIILEDSAHNLMAHWYTNQPNHLATRPLLDLP